MSDTPWLADYEQRVGSLEARVTRARTELAAIAETATAGAGAVSVTVSATGVLRKISFGERSGELSRPALADAVLEASSRAHAAALRRSRELLEALVSGSGIALLMPTVVPMAADQHLP